MVTAKQLANLKKDDFNITQDNAREMQAKSAAKRKENRTIREIYQEKLSKGKRKTNMLEAILEQAEKGNLAAYDRVVRDLREADGAHIGDNVIELHVSQATADILKKL